MASIKPNDRPDKVTQIQASDLALAAHDPRPAAFLQAATALRRQMIADGRDHSMPSDTSSE